MSIIILFFFLSCSNKYYVEQDYKVLKNQQQRAHSKPDSPLTEPFMINLSDFEDFKPLLIRLITRDFAAKFTTIEKVLIKQNLKNYPHGKLQDANTGPPVFHQHPGHWKGAWKDNEGEVTYNHYLSSPIQEDHIVYQKTIIGEWSESLRKNVDLIAGINSYDIKSGLIYGGVDVSIQGLVTETPHLGIYVNPHTLIWIARFDKNYPSDYSFYFEQIKQVKHKWIYSVKAISFKWDKESNKLLQPKWKEGQYLKIKDDE